MLSSENNDLLTLIEPGSIMGNLLRHFWMPALLEEELREDDCSRLERAAQTLGKEDILESLRVYRKRFDEEDPIVQPEFLVSSDITTEPDLKQESETDPNSSLS